MAVPCSYFWRDEKLPVGTTWRHESASTDPFSLHPSRTKQLIRPSPSSPSPQKRDVQVKSRAFNISVKSASSSNVTATTDSSNSTAANKISSAPSTPRRLKSASKPAPAPAATPSRPKAKTPARSSSRRSVVTASEKKSPRKSPSNLSRVSPMRVSSKKPKANSKLEERWSPSAEDSDRGGPPSDVTPKRTMRTRAMPPPAFEDPGSSGKRTRSEYKQSGIKPVVQFSYGEGPNRNIINITAEIPSAAPSPSNKRITPPQARESQRPQNPKRRSLEKDSDGDGSDKAVKRARTSRFRNSLLEDDESRGEETVPEARPSRTVSPSGDLAGRATLTEGDSSIVTDRRAPKDRQVDTEPSRQTGSPARNTRAQSLHHQEPTSKAKNKVNGSLSPKKESEVASDHSGRASPKHGAQSGGQNEPGIPGLEFHITEKNFNAIMGAVFSVLKRKKDKRQSLLRSQFGFEVIEMLRVK
ncbi:hypothetical protein HDU96_003322 [Phlyctochytrium bullatum]|nr:hypothetical protein HDU96_003322 [Phlyctochytrium bullatum]